MAIKLKGYGYIAYCGYAQVALFRENMELSSYNTMMQDYPNMIFPANVWSSNRKRMRLAFAERENYKNRSKGRAEYIASFESQKWAELPESEKIEHTVRNCHKCAQNPQYRLRKQNNAFADRLEFTQLKENQLTKPSSESLEIAEEFLELGTRIPPASVDDSVLNLYLEDTMSLEDLTQLYPVEFTQAKSGDRDDCYLPEFVNKVTARLEGYCIDLNLVCDDNHIIHSTSLFWLKVFSQPTSAALRNYKTDFMKTLAQHLPVGNSPEGVEEPYIHTHTVPSKESVTNLSLSELENSSDEMDTIDTNSGLNDRNVPVKLEPVETTSEFSSSDGNVPVKLEPVNMTSEFSSSGVKTEDLGLPWDIELDIVPQTTNLEPEKLPQASQKTQDVSKEDSSHIYYCCNSCSTLHSNRDFSLYLCLADGNHCSQNYVSCSKTALEEHQSQCHKKSKIGFKTIGAAAPATECSKRNSYSSKTLEFKRKIVLELERGTPGKVIAQREGLPKSTISTWLKNKAKILSDSDASRISRKDRKRWKITTKEGVDKALMKWFMQVRNANMRVNGPILLTKANQLAQEMNAEPVSRSWIDRWKIRYGIKNKRMMDKLVAREDITKSDDDGANNKSADNPPSYNEFFQSQDVVRRFLKSKPNTEKLLEYIDNIDTTFSAQALTQTKTDHFTVS